MSVAENPGRIVAVHPIVLLEPFAHLVMGSTLLGLIEVDGVGLALGAALVAAGFAVGIPAVRSAWIGLVKIDGTTLTLMKTGDRISPDQVTAIESRPGAHRLRFDPVHLMLAQFVDFGLIDLRLRDGANLRVGPARLAEVRPFLDAWRAGRSLPDATMRSAGYLIVGLAGSVALVAAAALATPNGQGVRSLLLICAGLLEIAFWAVTVVTIRRR